MSKVSGLCGRLITLFDLIDGLTMFQQGYFEKTKACAMYILCGTDMWKLKLYPIPFNELHHSVFTSVVYFKYKSGPLNIFMVETLECDLNIPRCIVLNGLGQRQLNGSQQVAALNVLKVNICTENVLTSVPKAFIQIKVMQKKYMDWTGFYASIYGNLYLDVFIVVFVGYVLTLFCSFNYHHSILVIILISAF